jgi:hypothetical protein
MALRALLGMDDLALVDQRRITAARSASALCGCAALGDGSVCAFAVTRAAN